ncbi:MAG: hypothetical protein B6U75_00135 [Desulfurococcales archaeon ex4484_217_1]|nr:MAG: hypothetical protein B6U75_00135 [Desulfurococcales archaeon ex4484_217_1]
MSKVRIIDGYRRILAVQREYVEELKEYNNLVKKFGFYLKPTHVVSVKGKKYIYHGRYWWKITYVREHGKTKVKWKYVGKDVPRGLPQPPRNPLKGLNYMREGNDVILNLDSFSKFKHIFYGLKLVIKE